MRLQLPHSTHGRTNHHHRPTTASHTERGQALVDYSLGLVLIGMVATLALVAVGPAINDALCQAVETMNPALADGCTGDGEVAGGEIMVLFAKYNGAKGQLDVQAKAPPDCPHDLEVAGMGPMERQGESYVFKYSETTGSPPESVTVGHSDCGWVTVPVE